MALTRKMLRAMGIKDEKADEIIEAHSETVDALKQKAADAGKGGEDGAHGSGERRLSLLIRQGARHGRRRPRALDGHAR